MQCRRCRFYGEVLVYRVGGLVLQVKGLRGWDTSGNMCRWFSLRRVSII